MGRLVFTVATGKRKYAEMAQGLGRSLKLMGDDTPRAVYTDVDGIDWERDFHHVIRPTEGRSALDKLRALELTDADQVLAIDGDCLAFGRLEPIFARLAGMPFAVQGGFQTGGHWHGADVATVLRMHGYPRFLKFNGGMLYYERGAAFEELLREMRRVEREYDASGFEPFRGNASEEVCVALACARLGYEGHVPDTADFMSTGPGMVGPLQRFSVLRGECQFLSHANGVRLVRPILFHASSLVHFRAYWRQLADLERVARYEDAHPSGWRSRGWRLRRSLERRYLRHVARKG